MGYHCHYQLIYLLILGDVGYVCQTGLVYWKKMAPEIDSKKVALLWFRMLRNGSHSQLMFMCLEAEV
jgi:hypothetical protein